MKNFILLSVLGITLGCSTFKTRTVASERPSCEEELKKQSDFESPDSVAQLCFDSVSKEWKTLGFIIPSTTKPSGLDNAIIANYIDHWAYLINQALRIENLAYIKTNQEKVNRLDQALLKYPIYRGIVFRGSTFPPAKKLETGMTFKDSAFVSTSLDFSVAEGYAGATGFISVILSKSGRTLSYDKSTDELSAEMEVLLPRGLSFKVFAIEKYKDTGHTLVYLVEN